MAEKARRGSMSEKNIFDMYILSVGIKPDDLDSIYSIASRATGLESQSNNVPLNIKKAFVASFLSNSGCVPKTIQAPKIHTTSPQNSGNSHVFYAA